MHFHPLEWLEGRLLLASVSGTKWNTDGPFSFKTDGTETIGGDGPTFITFRADGVAVTEQRLPLKWVQSGNTVTLSLDPVEAKKQAGVTPSGISYTKRNATVNGNKISGAFDCDWVFDTSFRDIPASLTWTFTGTLASSPPPGPAPRSQFVESWDNATARKYTPISEADDATFIKSGDNTWIVGDTQSDDGPSPNYAIIEKSGSNRSVRLQTIEANNGSANNLWINIREAGDVNKGFAVTLSKSTRIRFKVSGFLENPDKGSPNNIFRPYGDTVALLAETEAGDMVGYVLTRAADRKLDTSTDHYRDVYLDPSQGIYQRNLYKDFASIDGFTAGSPIARIEYEVSDVGHATLDDLYIGATPPNIAPRASLKKPAAPNAGASTLSFKVTFIDESTVDADTLPQAIRVTGPNQFQQTATLVRKDPDRDSTAIVATYRINAPGGTWNAADNGKYTVTLLDGKLKDTSGKSAGQKSLGSFNVSLVSTAGMSAAAVPGAVVSFSASPVKRLKDIFELL